MRLRAYYQGIALALATLALPLLHTDAAEAQTCGGTGAADDRGGSVVGTCDGAYPASPTSPKPATSPSPTGATPSDDALRNAWNSAGCGAFGEWAPGSTVSYAYDKPVAPEQLQKMAYDPSVPAAWYTVTCTPAGGPARTASAILPVSAAGPAAPPVNPLVLRDQARAQIQPALPGFAMSPAGSGGVPAVVNLETFMWLVPGYWRTVSRDNSQGAVAVRVEAAPVAVRWVMGDGSVRDCAGPGVAWSPGIRGGAGLGECTHRYRHASSTVPGGRFRG
jgi:hypothetical protein